MEEQNQNKSSLRLITYKGKTQSLQSWANEYGLRRDTLDGRLKRGWSVKKALTTPLKF